MTPVAIITAAVVLGVALMFWQNRRDRDLVERWAVREGWTLEDVKPARLHEHPDFLTVRITQRPAYRVRVTSDDRGGHSGVVVLGRGFLFTTLKHTRVWWDDQQVAARGFPVVPLNRPQGRPLSPTQPRARPMQTTTTTTKGATRFADISPATLARLNAGEVASRTLAEGLAVDFRQLLRAVSPQVGDAAVAAVDPAVGVTKRMALAAQALLAAGGDQAVGPLLAHPSDTVRGWAAYMVGLLPGLSLADRLARVRPLADDPHFGVREWAWLAVRPHVAADAGQAVALLATWTADPSANLRRFASEATRPRGVWCAHIDQLKASPELGLPILEPLRADPEKYVQDSVANWLNDAAKTRPAWVQALCARWAKASDVPATHRICKRALRSL